MEARNKAKGVGALERRGLVSGYSEGSKMGVHPRTAREVDQHFHAKAP